MAQTPRSMGISSSKSSTVSRCSESIRSDMMRTGHWYFSARLKASPVLL
ncbi:MAG: hypothetical protein HYZ74_04760 [Elusimicrobia bacterium]|nr:hypothetical protein [Elusimicrobiota bacterium]